MSKGYPFNVGDREPNWDANQPDFEAIRSKLEPEPKASTQPSATRHLLLILGGIAAAIVAFFTFSGGSEEADTAITTPQAVQESTDESPLSLTEEWQAEPSIFEIDPTRDNFVQTAEGVGLSLPAHAFGDIGESVVLEVSYYNDPIKVFASGIPMTYDSLGTMYHFMSDGMVKIRARAGNRAIELAEGMNLQLEIPALQDSTDFNIYTFDEEAQNWDYVESNHAKSYAQVCDDRIVQFLPAQETVSPEAVAETERAVDLLELEARSLRAETPLKPARKNPEADHFTLDVLASEFPALAAFADTEFEVRGRGFGLDIFDRTWDEITLDRIPESNQLLVSLKDGKREQTFKAVPVFEGEAFDAAMDQYASDRAAHSIKTNLCEDQLAEKAAILEDLKKQAGQDRLTSVQRSSAIFSMLVDDMDPEASFRQFSINSLGICNADLSIKLYKAPEIPVDVVIEHEGRAIRPARALLVDTERNAFYTLMGKDVQHPRFDRRRKHYLFATFDEGRQLCFVGPERLSALERKVELPQELKMEHCPGVVKSFEEFLDQIEESDL